MYSILCENHHWLRTRVVCTTSLHLIGATSYLGMSWGSLCVPAWTRSAGVSSPLAKWLTLSSTVSDCAGVVGGSSLNSCKGRCDCCTGMSTTLVYSLMGGVCVAWSWSVCVQESRGRLLCLRCGDSERWKNTRLFSWIRGNACTLIILPEVELQSVSKTMLHLQDGQYLS